MDITETVTLIFFLLVAFGSVYFFARDPRLTRKMIFDYFDRPGFEIRKEGQVNNIYAHGTKIASFTDSAIRVRPYGSSFAERTFVFGQHTFSDLDNFVEGTK